MAVFVKNIAGHFGPWVKERVVPKGRRPVRDGKTRAFASDEAADKEQRKCCASKNDSESMGPNARAPRNWPGIGAYRHGRAQWVLAAAPAPSCLSCGSQSSFTSGELYS